jgi:hypothetical protein
MMAFMTDEKTDNHMQLIVIVEPNIQNVPHQWKRLSDGFMRDLVLQSLKNNSASKQARRRISAANSMVTWQHRV